MLMNQVEKEFEGGRERTQGKETARGGDIGGWRTLSKDYFDQESRMVRLRSSAICSHNF